MKKALIYIDPEAAAGSVDLLEAVRQMYGQGDFVSYGLCLGSPDNRTLGALDNLIFIEDSALQPHDIIGITGCIEELQGEYGFDAVLIPATTFGRMLAPRAAMRLHTGLVADVTAIRHRNGLLELVRPAFSGRMLAGIVVRGRGPVMMSVRQNTFVYRKADDTAAKKAPSVVYHSPKRKEASGVRLVKRELKPDTDDIRESDILISGGGGVLRSFNRLEALAKELDGMVSASRRVVDSGAAPRHIQVGQSGKTVSPRLYLALGISGSIQHVVGLKNAEYIISVNSDRHAPICSLSDIVVEGDARDFIERMIQRLQQDGQTDPS